jgi:hypothetical protein
MLVKRGTFLVNHACVRALPLFDTAGNGVSEVFHLVLLVQNPTVVTSIGDMHHSNFPIAVQRRYECGAPQGAI